MTGLFDADSFWQCPRCQGSGKYWDDELGEMRLCSCTEPEAHARAGDPWTSQAAASSLEPPVLRESQELVLEAFRRAGAMCHEELCASYHLLGFRAQSVSGLRTRTKELVDLGLVADTGRVVKLPSGRSSIVWAAVEGRP